METIGGMKNLDMSLIRDIVAQRRKELEECREAFLKKEQGCDALECLMEQNEVLRNELADKERELGACRRENEKLQKECETAKESLKSLRSEYDTMKMQSIEIRKLSNDMAKKSDESVMLNAIKQYVNMSKRKSQEKKSYIKLMVFEMAAVASLTLPQDILDNLETFDDAYPQDAAVNVEGNYYHIHNNKNETKYTV